MTLPRNHLSDYGSVRSIEEEVTCVKHGAEIEILTTLLSNFVNKRYGVKSVTLFVGQHHASREVFGTKPTCLFLEE